MLVLINTWKKAFDQCHTNYTAYINYQKSRTFLILDKGEFVRDLNVRNSSAPYFLDLSKYFFRHLSEIYVSEIFGSEIFGN